jgi:TM2 domain-containing membrane protein YozV
MNDDDILEALGSGHSQPAVKPGVMEGSIKTKMRDCRYCKSQIEADVWVCPHCGKETRASYAVANMKHERDKHGANIGESNVPWSPGLAAVMSFIIPGLGQIYKGQIGSGLGWFLGVIVGYACFVLPGIAFHVWCVFNAFNAPKQ